MDRQTSQPSRLRGLGLPTAAFGIGNPPMRLDCSRPWLKTIPHITSPCGNIPPVILCFYLPKPASITFFRSCSKLNRLLSSPISLLDAAQLHLALCLRQTTFSKLFRYIRLKLVPQNPKIRIPPYRAISVFKLTGPYALDNDPHVDKWRGNAILLTSFPGVHAGVNPRIALGDFGYAV